jgi:D-glycero-alpha-D-manno-heptose-7-phosphate kinase
MIITRTPFRISFFGGGTDYPAWYRKHGGAVLVTSINKYCYLTCRYLPPFFEHNYRIVYIKSENCVTIDEISHPAVRGVLGHLDWKRGLEIHHDADLPARGGMGSSSAFTVGLLHALHGLRSKLVSKQALSEQAIHFEQNILHETVGSQDQIAAAYGGLNEVAFHTGGDFTVTPLTIGRDRVRELESHLMLFFTGVKRTASDVARSYVDDIEKRAAQLNALNTLTKQGVSLLYSGESMAEFGRLLDKAWALKRSWSKVVSNNFVDDLYERAKGAGALGGKIMGAGGGGFMLLFVPPQKQNDVKRALGNMIHVPFRFESGGSQIIFYDQQEDFSSIDPAGSSQPARSFRDLETLQV